VFFLLYDQIRPHFSVGARTASFSTVSVHLITLTCSARLRSSKLANALFSASRFSEVELHFNKGLAGAPSEAIETARDTAMNPAVCSAFALAIVADGQGPAYPGIPDHEPNVAEGRKAADAVHRSMNELRAVVSDGGAYVSESNFFESGFEQS
jgi:hypothetical protein